MTSIAAMATGVTPPGAAPPRLAERARTVLSDRDGASDLGLLATGTALGGAAARLAGRSVLIATRTQRAAAIAMVELDGIVSRMTLAPPGLGADHLRTVLADAAVDLVVTDDRDAVDTSRPVALIAPTIETGAGRVARPHDTQWVMLTSGTSGRAKIVAHTLAALTATIAPISAGGTRPVWGTFYDIRRYGGHQVLLRALLGGSALVLGSAGEGVGDHLRRLGAAGVTAISGTPSHWRGVLMSRERNAIAPSYVRLSGETADQAVIDRLRATYPRAHVGHAYASTEAGVGFVVDDGLAGFPAALLEEPSSTRSLADFAMTVVDGSLRVRSARAATGYLGPDAPPLAGADGFIDTGDLVERRGTRYHFVGRRNGIINVGGLKVNPEEVEAVLNAHPAVSMSLVKARRNALTGAIVVADVVLRDDVALRDPGGGTETVEAAITEACRAALERHKVPAIIRFVPALALTAAGKVSRAS